MKKGRNKRLSALYHLFQLESCPSSWQTPHRCFFLPKARREPGSGCSEHVSAGQCHQFRGSVTLCWGKAAEMGPPSAVLQGTVGGNITNFSTIYFKREGETERNPTYKIPWSVHTLCSLDLFSYFCGSAEPQGEGFNRKTTAPSSSSAFKKCSA